MLRFLAGVFLVSVLAGAAFSVQIEQTQAFKESVIAQGIAKDAKVACEAVKADAWNKRVTAEPLMVDGEAAWAAKQLNVLAVGGMGKWKQGEALRNWGKGNWDGGEMNYQPFAVPAHDNAFKDYIDGIELHNFGNYPAAKAKFQSAATGYGAANPLFVACSGYYSQSATTYVVLLTFLSPY